MTRPIATILADIRAASPDAMNRMALWPDDDLRAVATELEAAYAALRCLVGPQPWKHAQHCAVIARALEHEE